jgi:hypothetical protein
MATQVKTPATFSDDSSTGTEVWASPGNAAASDNSYTTVVVNGTTKPFSHYLKGLMGGNAFSLAAGDTPTLMTVDIERSKPAADFGDVRDVNVLLVKAGVIQSDNQADTLNDWPETDTVKSYTFSLAGWSVADVNNANSGVVISVTEIRDDDATARIDHVQLTATYTPAPYGDAAAGVRATPLLQSGGNTMGYPSFRDAYYQALLEAVPRGVSGVP